jgi:hypothetical protein
MIGLPYPVWGSAIQRTSTNLKT